MQNGLAVMGILQVQNIFRPIIFSTGLYRNVGLRGYFYGVY